MLKKSFAKRLSALLVGMALLASTLPVQAYLTEDGKEAEMIKLERIVSSTESMVGRTETVTYNLTGDTIVYDPPKEIALVVDVSGSMADNVTGGKATGANPSRISIMKDALKNFIKDWQGRNARICIVPFCNSVEQAPVLISMKAADCMTDLNAQINALATKSSTNIGDGMRVAYHTLNNSTNTGASKYIITMTDGEPNYYSCVSTSDKNTYYTGSGIIPSNRAISSSTKGLDYIISPTGVTKLILNNGRFKSFVIGFATAASLTTNLNQIGSCSGAQKVEGTDKYFYYAGKASELNQAYLDISSIISKDVPFSSALFSELLPEGTVIDSAARPALEAEGYLINDSYVDGAGKVRTLVTRSLSGKISLTRKYPEATTSPKNLVYQLKPFSFSIQIQFTTPGTKVFQKEDGKINYDDPFENKAYYANCTSVHIISVVRPVSGLTNTHAIVMVDQREPDGKITANTTPSDAYLKKIKDWTMESAVDEMGNPAVLNDIITMSSPSPADENNSIRLVKGKKAGKAVVEAETEGKTLNGSTTTGSSFVFVVDGKVRNLSVNKGDVKDLKEYTQKLVPATNTAEVKPEFMTFSGWRLDNPADSRFVEIQTDPVTKQATGVIRILDKIDSGIKLLADVKYDVPAAGIHLSKTVAFQVVAGVLVEGVSLNGALLMAGDTAALGAAVTPGNAYNRKIGSWSLVDGLAPNGDVVPDGGAIADLRTAADPLNLNAARSITGLKAGSVKVIAETEGIGADGKTKTAEARIYVLDAACETSKTIKLWCTDKITVEGIIPESLKRVENGQFTYTFSSSDPASLSAKVTEGKYNECELKALAIPADGKPVLLTVTAEYCRDAIATGVKKTIVCRIVIEQSNIDIN